jgi:hypothetical protein
MLTAKSLSRFTLPLLALTTLAQVPATYGSLPDISGTGSVAALSASHVYVNWIQLLAPSANVSNVACCDAAITSTRGASITPGQGWFLPYTGQIQDLAQTYTLIQSGDKLKVSYQLAKLP